MNNKRFEKVRFTIALPKNLYDLLNDDSIKFGMPKSNILAMLLFEYYKSPEDERQPSCVKEQA